jgi:transitional endoplasmic reticulum ATPase
MTEQEKKDQAFKNVTVGYANDPEAKSIVLPQGMSLKKGAEWLLVQDAEMGKEVGLHYTFPNYYPLDAALALYKALMRTYGFTSLVGTPSFWGEKPPVLVGVEVEPGVTVQIPWGSMQISGITGRLETGATLVENKATFVLAGKVVQRDRGQVDKIVALAKDILKSESIYKGKAVVVDLPDQNFDILKAPKFMDLTGVQESDLIFPRVVQEAVETNIFAPIKHTALCRQHQIPRRRGILLAGPYGCGKTLTSRVTAKVAVDNGWTFIYVNDLKQLPQALHFAKSYAPAVIFGEDINRVVSGERDEEMDEYFNVIDGIDRKADEVMVVFTTNEVEEIHPGMMRPGRIDAMIEVTPPDADATARLVRVYGRGLIDPNANLDLVGTILSGHIPAVTREAVERAKLVAIQDCGGGELVVREEHLVSAAHQLVAHSAYINRQYGPEKPDLQVLGEAIGGEISKAMNFRREALEDDYEFNDDTKPVEENLKQLVSEALDKSGRGGKRKNGNGRAAKTE